MVGDESWEVLRPAEQHSTEFLAVDGRPRSAKRTTMIGHIPKVETILIGHTPKFPFPCLRQLEGHGDGGAGLLH